MEEASLGRALVRLVSDFQNPLVVLCPLMVAELAPLRHGRADVPRLEVPERSDVASVLRVLVTQETRAPARVVALPAFPLRDRRDVDHRSLAAKFGDWNLFPQESACVLDSIFDRSAAHSIFHQVRLLLRDASDERRLRVRDDPTSSMEAASTFVHASSAS